MIPMERASPEERRLLKLFRALEPQDRATLLAFAQFLMAGGAANDTRPSNQKDETDALAQQPRPEPRPQDESVIAAIKRLRRVYPMLDPGEMLHETSSLMAAHVLQGRDAGAVIDELEYLFSAHYEALSKSDAQEP
ncbi:hypothetical protein CKO40_02915 [Halochromatium glycolicum]|uniref:Crp/Fnr family transcriptional regulator n=2 Tax=Halochromatium glycolicum TaxID=85075 RepID=A0AAJ0U1N2_9GAMM|nr:hypothetical protein [Halochromatium glycolicum]MBK1703532.1 hypothetical protein [Halochromatium glycolicum]